MVREQHLSQSLSEAITANPYGYSAERVPGSWLSLLSDGLQNKSVFRVPLSFTTFLTCACNAFFFHRCREPSARDGDGPFLHAYVGQRRCWPFVSDHQAPWEAARRQTVRAKRARWANRWRDLLHRNISIASCSGKIIAYKTILPTLNSSMPMVLAVLIN